jgi:hypothetical protein
MTERRRLPNRREHEVFAQEHAGLRFTAGAGRYNDGRLAELFINTETIGAVIDAISLDGGA